MECLTMVTQKDIEIGKTKIAMSYTSLIAYLLLIGGSLTAMWNFGGNFRELTYRLGQLESASDRRFDDIEDQIKEIRDQMKENEKKYQKDKDEEKEHRKILESMIKKLLEQKKD